MHVALLDTEEGRDSVRDLIDAGKVTVYDCSSFEKIEKVYWAFVNKQISADLIVWDTLSSSVDQFVSDVTIDPEDLRGKTIWSVRNKMRQNQDIWNRVNYGIKFLITGFRELPIPTIFNVHEREREDFTAEADDVERNMPALTPKILAHTMARSDLVLRLYRSPIAFTHDGKQYDKDTRMLQIANTADAYTGVRVTPTLDASLPPVIVDPTLAKLAATLGYLPKKITVYSFPKVGKTVFACTLPS